MRYSLILVSALLLSPLALAQQAMSSGQSTTASQPAQQLLNEVQTAFNQHDANKLAKLFAPDATIIGPDGARMHGTQQIQTDMTKQMQNQFQGTQSTFTLDGTRPVGSDAMWVDATHQVTNMKKPDGTRGSMTFHLAALIEKQGNRWVAVEVRPYAYMPSKMQGVGGAGSGMK